MRVAIIGAGNVGRALAGALGVKHAVVFGVRDPGAAVDGVATVTVADAAQTADAVILATPFDAAADALAGCGDLRGKAVIDATNPLTTTSAGLALAIGFETSGAERLAATAPTASIFKAFKETA